MSAGKIIYWILWIPMIFMLVVAYAISYFSLGVYFLRQMAQDLHKDIKEM